MARQLTVSSDHGNDHANARKLPTDPEPRIREDSPAYV